MALLVAVLVSSFNSPLSTAKAQVVRPELVLQTGHAFRVDSIAFSPDGSLIASASADNTVRLWDVATTRELRRLTGHENYVKTVDFAPDGNVVASGSADGSVRIWDVATGAESKRLDGNGSVTVVAHSLDGRLLAAANMSGGIKIWDVATGALLESIPNAHAGHVTALSFSRDGKLASGGKDNVVQLWHARNGTKLKTLTGHSALVKAIAFSPNGELVATASFDKTVRLWNISKGTEEKALAGHATKAVAVSFAQDGATLLSADSSKTIKVWNVQNGNALRSLAGSATPDSGEPPSEVITFSRDGSRVATSNGDKSVQVREIADGSAEQLFASYSSGVYTTAFSPDKRWFATGSKDRTLRIWEVSTGRKVRTLTGHTGWVTHIVFSPDGQLLVSGSLSGAAKLWDVNTGRELRTLQGHSESINSVGFSADSKLIFTGSGDMTARLWDASSGKEIQTFKGHTGEVNSVALSRDGKTLATGSADTTIRLWTADTGQTIRVLRPESGEIFSLVFTPDDSALAIGSSNGKLQLWNLSSDVLRAAAGATSAIRSVAFSPDGNWIAAGSSDASLKLWSVASLSDPRVMRGHADAINGITFSADGKWLSSGSEDATARLWEVATGELKATLVTMTDSADWLVVTPDGLFDGSPSAWNQILWRFAGNTRSVAPVEVFFNEFFYPDLLSDILAGKRPKATRDIAAIDRRQPTLSLAIANSSRSDSRNVTLRIAIKSAPAGAKDVRLFRNGSLVKVWRGEATGTFGGSTPELEATVPLVAGENYFSTYAFNQANIKSLDASIQIVGAESLRRPATTYILAVGINKYANSQYDLKYAVADAQDFAEEVKRQRNRVDTGAKTEVAFLLDQDATKANILKALRRLSGADTTPSPDAPAFLRQLKPAEPEDVVVIYFAGHGTANKDRFFLIPHDLGYMGNRDIKGEFNMAAMLEHSISDVELERILEPLNASQLALVIDACNSGQALEAEEKRRGPMNSKGLAQLAYEKGMYVLTAAQSYQAALEAAQLGHGYLTYALVEEGLRRGEGDLPTSRDGNVLVREWFDYASERVPQMQIGAMQSKRGLGSSIAFASDGSEDVQRPRVFYRREMDIRPLVVARLGAARVER